MNLFSKKVIGLEFQDYSAHLVELKLSKGKISLEAYNRIILPRDVIRDGEIKKEEELKNILSTFLKTANPKPVYAKNVAILFPSSKTFTHLFTFPITLNEDEIKKAIVYEVETIIPFSIEEVYWDFVVLQKEETKKKHASQYVLFVAIPKSIGDQYVHLLESIGLTPFLFSSHVESLKYALMQEIDHQTILAIEFNPLSTNYLILKNKSIAYFFSFNSGGMDLIKTIAKEFQIPEAKVIEQREKNKFDPKWTPFIQNFLQTHYQLGQNILKDHGPVDEIILTGEFLNLPSFYEYAEKYFPKTKVSIGDPKLGLQIEREKFLPLQKKQKNPVPYSTYFTDAIGIALRGLMSKNGINLLPDRLRENFANKKMAFLTAIASISMSLVTLLFGTSIFILQQRSTYERLHLEIQKSAIEQLLYGTRYQEIRENILNFNQEVAELARIDQALFSMPAVLTELEKQIPEGITLSLISYEDKDLSFEINGIAKTRDKLLETKNNFENTPWVSEVIAPISNYDEKSEISFIMKIKLDPSQLPHYASSSNS